MKTPRWVQLIRAHQNGEGEKRNGYGLGIPFLIGGSRPTQRSVQTSPDQVRIEIRELLASFIEDAPLDHAVRVDRCREDMENSPVAALVYYGMRTDKGFMSQSQKRTTLLLAPGFEREGVTSIPALEDKLFEELHQHICQGRFSFRGGEYRGFSETDLLLIESSKRL